MYANASIEIQLHTAANLKFRASFSDLVSSAKVGDVMSRYCVMLHFVLQQFYVKMPEWPCPTVGGEDIKMKKCWRNIHFMMMDYCPGKSWILEFFGKGKEISCVETASNISGFILRSCHFIAACLL
ncbi:hypothetical protein CDAR_620391 [Caerostris darwini]|uniref:Uncharacterized protein n=1 Tax=Caerostris darwini TaxID=1538125 RepID=A0AAV4VJW2_9ARAC|nr:hypothetical protein CDAR_620391 [Caerostris darwini]